MLESLTGELGSWGCLARLAAGALLGAVVVSAVVYVDYRSAIESDVLEAGESQTFRIPEGVDWSETRATLRESDLVDHPLYFEIWARVRGLPREVGAGTYHLEGPLAVRELAERLRSGGAARDVRVTLQEGLTIFEMADRLASKELFEREAFLRAARDEKLLRQAGIDAESFEGYLFPETYRFAADVAPEEVVWQLYDEWRRVWERIVSKHPNAPGRMQRRYGLDRHGLVTLASIVDAETSVESERPLVARVMLNRLEESMRLQADPTCVYGPERYDEVPSPETCREAANEYSTYVRDGLPPGPIGNPGAASLEAVLDPASGEPASEYLFYCARRDGKGRHVFSTSYEAHKRAVDKHLR